MIDKIPNYNFFFHPLSEDHSDCTKAASVVTVIALSILTGSLYFWVFLAINLRNRPIKKQQGAT